MRWPSSFLWLALLLLLQSERTRGFALQAAALQSEAAKGREGKTTQSDGPRAQRRELKRQLNVHLNRLQELETLPAATACQLVHQQIDNMESEGLTVSAET